MLKEDRQVLWALVIVGVGILGAVAVGEVEKAFPALSQCKTGDNECLLANYTGNLATYTAVMAWATLVLGLLGIVGGVFSYRQLRLARDEFVAAHRPKLVIREVFWTTLAKDHTSVVSFTLINRGRSRCRVIESAFEVRSANPVAQFITDGTNSLGNILLVPGEFCFKRVVADPLIAAARNMLDETFLRGIIIYEDDANISRRTVICRRSVKGDDRFRSLGDPEQEYTD